jgi:hypothetical protein
MTLGWVQLFISNRKKEVTKMITENAAQNFLDFVNPEPCSPSEKDPSKNALCPYYDQCLNLAVEENWAQFTCQGCVFKNSHVQIKPNACEMMGYYRLISKIFVRKEDGALVFH